MDALVLVLRVLVDSDGRIPAGLLRLLRLPVPLVIELFKGDDGGPLQEGGVVGKGQVDGLLCRLRGSVQCRS